MNIQYNSSKLKPKVYFFVSQQRHTNVRFYVNRKATNFKRQIPESNNYKVTCISRSGLEERYFHFKFVSYFESKVNELDFWLSILMTSSIVGPDIQTITCDK